MDLIKWDNIYQENKRLDAIFYEKYQDDYDIYRKNCIELFVELGEFLNETKVFKYWTNKKPNQKKVLEEYADTITMCLTFLNGLNINLEDDYEHGEFDDTLSLINYLYQKIGLLQDNKDTYLVKDIFYNMLYLGSKLGLTEEEILNAIKIKHKIIEERLNSNY